MNTSLEGPHARVQVQALGGMLGPVTFRLPDGREVSPLYRAPWHGEDGPGLRGNPLLRHLNGDWVCAPYGPAAAPPDLPPGWQVRPLDDTAADAGWDHGWIANHPWRVVAGDAGHLHLAIEPPPGHALERVERLVSLSPDGPGLEVITRLHPRRTVTWPVALHPTFAWPPGGLELRPGALRAVHTYPVAPVPGVSRLQPGAVASSLQALPTQSGGLLDLQRLPLADDTEELLQLQEVQPPFVLRWWPQPAGAGAGAPIPIGRPADAREPIDLEIDWDASLLPDLLLWISQRGRRHAPWSGRNLALGIEPCASCFDLTRVAEPPAGHPLAHRQGLLLKAGEARTLRWSLRAV